MKKILLVLLALAIPVLLLAAEPVRVWKSQSGAPVIEAQFDISRDSDPETVYLLKDGKRFKAPLNKLSKEDQDYVTKVRERAKSLDDKDGILEEVKDGENGRGLAVVPAGNQYALLIGVNEYAKPIKSLKFCVNDMKLLAECFEEIGVPKENIFLVTDESPAERRPTAANIREQIELVTGIMGPNDQLTIAFSGHGAMVDGKSYLCPSDTNLDKKDSIISRDWAFEQLEKCKAKQKIFIIDACRDEVSFGDQKALSGAKTLEDPFGAETHGFILIASCDKTQRSWEHPELKHGVFTYFLAKGLAGEAKDEDGYVSILNLFQYASAKTKKYVYHEFNKPQVPTFRQGSEMTDFCIARIKGISVQPAAQTKPEIAKPTPDPVASSQSAVAAPANRTPTSMNSFVWKGSTIVKFIGKETDVVIPKGARKIENKAFENCTSLKSIVIPEGVIEIDYSSFEGCTSLTSIVIPKSIILIGRGAFQSCSSLTKVEIPEGVTRIADYTFEDCSSLTSVVIPESVTQIGNRAFNGCSSLTSVNIPDSVSTIGDGAFAGCAKLKNLSVSNNNHYYKTSNGCLLTKNGQELVSYPSATGKYHIPDGVIKIGNYAFKGCSALTSVVIPESATQIGEHAFDKCSSLTSVVIPESVTEIGGYVFEDCSSLASVSLPKGITEIKYSLFSNCSSLKSVVIPRSVTRIRADAFRDCSSLESVAIPEGLDEIDRFAFKGCNALISIDIPESVSKIGGGAFADCIKLKDIRVSNNNPIYKCSNGCLLTRNGQELVSYPSVSGDYQIPYGIKRIEEHAFEGCNSLMSVSIPGSVTSIESSAFRDCISLKAVVIPGNVSKISSCSFEGCIALKSVIIQKGVKEIGSDAFEDCRELSTVVIPDSVTKISDDAFRGCTSLTNWQVSNYHPKFKSIKECLLSKEGILLQCPAATGEYKIPYGIKGFEIFGHSFRSCKNLKSIVIPESVTEIYSDAFSRLTLLESVVIPNSVTKIDNGAFRECTSLKSVTIPASVKEIGSSAFSGCTSLKSIIIPDSVQKIGAFAFMDCTSLVSITIPEGITDMPCGLCKNCYALKSVSIPDSVTTFTSGFEGCCSLKSIRISKSVTILGSAFSRCSSLRDVKISYDNPAYWSDYHGCIFSKDGSKLVSFPSASGTYEIPDKVKIIDSNAFQGCNTLTFIIIPNSVTEIYYDAFRDCSALTSVIIPNGVEEINSGTFDGCTSLTSITIPESVEKIADGSFKDCISLKNINIAKDNPHFICVQGCILSRDGRTLIACPAASGDFIVPDGVTEIKNYAFYGCYFLKSVTIPDSVTDIGFGAFNECNSLKTVTILNRNVKIGDYVFSLVDGLTIRAPSGSTAEAYAEKEKYKFEKLDE